MNLFIGMITGGIRPTDGFIFTSEATRRVYENVWTHWRDEGYLKARPPKCLVSPNPIDLQANQRDEDLRERTRKVLGIGREQVVFLTFNRLEPSTKGDLPSLIASWSRVLETSPNAVLMLTGAMSAEAALFVEQVKSFARVTGVSQNLIILPNPFDLFADARNALMSASDVFLHISLGVEESAPLTILEAMAHQLPPIVASWSGMIEQIVDGESGFLVPTRYVGAPETQSQLFWGRHAIIANRDATTFACLEPIEFIKIVNKLAQNPPLRQAVGLSAFERVKSRFNIERIARDRVGFIREAAAEARRSPVETERAVLVGIDNITRGLACGSELTPMDTVRQGQLMDKSHLGFWVDERLLGLATFMLDKLEGSNPKSLAGLFAEVLRDSGQTTDQPIPKVWVSEFGKHFQWVTLRLIAAGLWILDGNSNDLKSLSKTK
jgi:glycosyltransferase involved in cell wall biosynthesis